MVSVDRRLDLLGVPCPLNWARTKVVLESMRVGEVLELVVDDPRAATDIPRAAEACGHAVLDCRTLQQRCVIVIER